MTAAGIALALLAALVALPGSSAAAAVDVPDRVTAGDELTFTASVDAGTDDPAIENLTLHLSPAGDDESVAVTIAPDGTITDVSPARGVVGEGEIRIDQLRRSIVVAAVGGGTPDGDGYGYDGDGYGYDGGADTGYGYDGAGYGPDDSGYGYDGTGYGGADGQAVYDITIDSRALKHGTYDVWLAVATSDGTERSARATFTVTVPGEADVPGRSDEAGDGRGSGAPSEETRAKGNGVGYPTPDEVRSSFQRLDPGTRAKLPGGVEALMRRVQAMQNASAGGNATASGEVAGPGNETAGGTATDDGDGTVGNATTAVTTTPATGDTTRSRILPTGRW